MSRAGAFALSVVVLGAGPLCADEIQLHGGGRISGIVVKQTPRFVVIETSPGLVTIPVSRIERVIAGTSSLEIWRERSAALDHGDSRGWASLARWAEDAGLTTQARGAWERVLAADPGNADAHRALGHVQYQGQWMDSDDAYRSRGFVQVDGRWMSLAEHEALIRQRAQEDAADLEREAAAVRLREAEARAQEAEALARAAANGANSASGDVWWGGYGYPYPYTDPDRYGDGRRGDRHDGRGLHVEPHGQGDGQRRGGNDRRPARPPDGGGTTPSKPPAPRPHTAGVVVPRN
jgi:hypothetical protein